jgi:hypothetical protein
VSLLTGGLLVRIQPEEPILLRRIVILVPASGGARLACSSGLARIQPEEPFSSKAGNGLIGLPSRVSAPLRSPRRRIQPRSQSLQAVAAVALVSHARLWGICGEGVWSAQRVSALLLRSSAHSISRREPPCSRNAAGRGSNHVEQGNNHSERRLTASSDPDACSPLPAIESATVPSDVTRLLAASGMIEKDAAAAVAQLRTTNMCSNRSRFPIEMPITRRLLLALGPILRLA